MRSDRIKAGPHKWLQRGYLKGSGRTQAEIDRPFIGVVGAWSDIFAGAMHLDKLAKAASDGVLMAGGTPLTFNTIGICDGMVMNTCGMKYSLPSRELIADSIETMAEAHGFDGLVLLPSCDKIIPGMLIAALRLNIPAIVVTAGPAMAGTYRGKRYFAEEVARCAILAAKGEAEMEVLHRFEDNGSSGATCGSCYGMYTANSMGILTEVIGLGLPGNGTVPAPYAERTRMAKSAGMRVLELVREDIKPRDIVTREGMLNAIVVDMMVGCSTNTALHIPAIADAAGLTVTLDDFDIISRKVPQISKLSPASHVLIEDLHAAGGISAVMKQALDAGLLDGSAKSVAGQTIAEITKDAVNYDDTVICPFDKPFYPEGGLAVLKGNLAPVGAIIKVGGVVPSMLKHSGPARVFNSEDEGFNALIKNEIKPGDVIVIRYEGPKGGPGMQEMLALTLALISHDLADKCALITDGRFSGGSAGPVIGHISPEAAAGGLIALIEDGDIISYDCAARTLNLEVDIKTLEKRRAAWVCPPPKVTSGWLARYAQLCTSASCGAMVKADCER